MAEQIVDLMEAIMPASSDVVAEARSAGGAAGMVAGSLAASSLAGPVLDRVDALSARVDVLAASGDGDGGDMGTELRDVRVGWDGVVSASAGEAVRRQIGGCVTRSVDALSQINSRLMPFAIRLTVPGAFIHVDGDESELSGAYRSDYVFVGGCSRIDARSAINSTGFAIALYGSDFKLLADLSVPGVGGGLYRSYSVDLSKPGYQGVVYAVVSDYNPRSAEGYSAYATPTINDVSTIVDTVYDDIDQIASHLPAWPIVLSEYGSYLGLDGSVVSYEPSARSMPMYVGGCSRVEATIKLSSNGLAIALYDKDRQFLPDLSVPGTSGAEYRSYEVDLSDNRYAAVRYAVCCDFDRDGHAGFSARAVPLDSMPIPRTYGTFSILGDSYSTFKGFLSDPSAPTWYPASDNPDADGNDVEQVDQTWWWRFARECGCRLLENVSWSGSPISYDGYSEGDMDAERTSFIGRMDQLGTPELILVFGGTNDVGVANKGGTADTFLGDYQWEGWDDVDLTKFRPALARLLDGLMHDHVGARIVFILNTGLKLIEDSVDTICAHYGVDVLHLHDIDKASEHPTAAGMSAIADQLAEYLGRN